LTKANREIRKGRKKGRECSSGKVLSLARRGSKQKITITVNRQLATIGKRAN